MERTFTWVHNIINSCNSDYHFDCADALITLFESKYKDDDVVFSLKQLRYSKWAAIHSILI